MSQVLIEAILDEDFATFVKHCTEADIKAEVKEDCLLHTAATFGNTQVVRYLIDNGANINFRSGPWWAPAISYAASNGHLEIVRMLHDAGAFFDDADALKNPLLRAAGSGHLDVVKFLLEKGANAKACYRNMSGSLINAFTHAKKSRNKELLELLKSYGCSEPVEGVDKPIWEPKNEAKMENSQRTRVDEILDYMTARFGPVDQISQQELLSQGLGISISIHCIPPNEVHPYYVLFTTGMSDLPMTVPAGKDEWKFAELVMHLPETWHHPLKDKDSENWSWPMGVLRRAASAPHLAKSWLAPPSTIISFSAEERPLGPGTELSSLLLVPRFANLREPLSYEGNTINFFTVVPIHASERKFEKEFGMSKFLRKFVDEKVPMIADFQRKPFN